MNPRREIKPGYQYGRLTVIEARQDDIRCLCSCGTEHLVKRLAWGRIASCGCGRREWAASLNSTHGMTGTPAYISWQAMIQRCANPKAPDYARYGGRGITVCEQWRDFEAFYADMGERPADRTLDRIDVNGNYGPGNCQWATVTEQNLNRRPRAKCKRGHELSEENVYREKDGRRRCLPCRRLMKRDRRQSRMAGER